MATAGISTVFAITVNGPADLNVAKTFTAPRAFTVIGVQAQNLAAGAGTLTITNAGTAFTGTTAAPPIAGAAIVEAQADSQGMSNCALIEANCNVAAGAAVIITASAATVSRVVITCVSGNGTDGESISIA